MMQTHFWLWHILDLNAQYLGLKYDKSRSHVTLLATFKPRLGGLSTSEQFSAVRVGHQVVVGFIAGMLTVAGGTASGL